MRRRTSVCQNVLKHRASFGETDNGLCDPRWWTDLIMAMAQWLESRTKPHVGGVRIGEGQRFDWQGQGSGSGPQGSITRESLDQHFVVAGLNLGPAVID